MRTLGPGKVATLQKGLKAPALNELGVMVTVLPDSYVFKHVYNL